MTGEEDQTASVEVKSLKKGNFCMIRDQPCRITEMTQKPKATSEEKDRIHLVGVHMSTGKKYENTLLASLQIDQILVTRETYDVLDVDTHNATVSVMLKSGERKDDRNLEDMAGEEYKTVSVEVKSLKMGCFCMIRDHPCCITEMTQKPKATSKENDRIHLVGVHMSTGKKYEDTLLATLQIDQILVTRETYDVVDVDTHNAPGSVMLKSGESKDDLNLVGSDIPQEQYSPVCRDLVARFDLGEDLKLKVTVMDDKPFVVEKDINGIDNNRTRTLAEEKEQDTEKLAALEPINDTVLEEVKRKKLKTRIKLENLKSSTDEYLDDHQPVNTKMAVKTAIAAFENVIKQIQPNENRNLEEMPEEDLADYLEQFFKCVMKQDGSTYNASTLSTYYNSLCRFFVEKRQINIKTNEKFCRVGKVLGRRQEESMKEGEIPGKHAAKAIPKEVLAEAISQGKIGYEEPRGLTANVIKAFQAGFGIRNREEMYNIINRDIEIGPEIINGIPEYIELGERITKMRRGKGGKGKLKL